MDQLLGILLIALFVSTLFIVLSIKRANKEYLKCACGRDPVLMYCDYLGKYRYECDCGLIGEPAEGKHDAKIFWYNLIEYHKMYDIEDCC